MTLSEMRDSLRAKIGNPTTSSVSDSTLNQLLNESNRYIMDRYPFHESRSLSTFDTVVGTKRYQLPTDLAVLMKVGNRTKGYRIGRREADWQFSKEDQSTDSTGQPRKYTRMLDWIQFYPIPDKVYTIAIFYKNVIADIVGDGSSSLTPLTWHPGIVLYARYLYYDQNQDFAKSQYAYASWSLWLGDKPSEFYEEMLYDGDQRSAAPTRTAGSHRTGDFNIDDD